MSNASDTAELLHRAGAGDHRAIADAFDRYRDRLRRMVRLRMDGRLQGRLDPSAVLQEALADVEARAADYLASPSMPFYLWLRQVTGERLMTLHRRHLGLALPSAGQELSLYRGALPAATCEALAGQLLGRFSSPSQACQRAAMQLRLQGLLNGMDPMDREILALRHFEELSNGEAAVVLGIDGAAASNRYLRALKRLSEMLAALPGFSRN